MMRRVRRLAAGSVRRLPAIGVLVALVLLAQGMADPLVAQQGAASGSFRPYLYVFIAFGAAWTIIGMWVFQIGRRLKRVSEQLERVAGE